MRKLAVVLAAVLALGAPAHALANTDSGAAGGWPVDWPPEPPPTTEPPIVYWLRTIVDSLIEVPRIPTPRPMPAPTPPCTYLGYLATDPEPAYVRCTTQATPVSDSRTGASYTTTASADVCRAEPSGDECVGTAQSVGRTGAEVAPAAEVQSADMALPQACVGSMCTSGTVRDVPRNVTVFESGTTAEATAYTPTGAVNANAPQVCVSIDNSCTATGATGTDRAAVENVNATKVLTTN